MDYLSKNVAANLKRIRKSKCMSLDQAAEEINVPLKKIGKMMILSVVLAVVFYSFVILAVGYVLNPEGINLILRTQQIELLNSYYNGKKETQKPEEN